MWKRENAINNLRLGVGKRGDAIERHLALLKKFEEKKERITHELMEARKNWMEIINQIQIINNKPKKGIEND